MAWADQITYLNNIAIATFGEPVRYAHGATTADLIAVIRKRHDPFMVDGS